MGVDLAPALGGAIAPPNLLAFSHTALPPLAFYKNSSSSITNRITHRSPRRDPSEFWVAVREGDLVFKLTSQNGIEFRLSVFDWNEDPEERKDLYDPDSLVQHDMLRKLEDYKAELVVAYRRWQQDAPEQLPEPLRNDLLRSLGYIE